MIRAFVLSLCYGQQLMPSLAQKEQLLLLKASF